MINYKTIKESESFRRPYHDDNLHTVQLIELDSSYIVKDELPCYWLVGVVGYINYRDQFVGAIHHYSSQKDAEDKYSELCDRYSVKEEEVFGV